MPVKKWMKKPIQFEAIQWTGDNFDEVTEFVGKMNFGFLNGIARLYVAANDQWLLLDIGEHIIQDELGFYPCKDKVMRNNNMEITNANS